MARGGRAVRAMQKFRISLTTDDSKDPWIGRHVVEASKPHVAIRRALGGISGVAALTLKRGETLTVICERIDQGAVRRTKPRLEIGEVDAIRKRRSRATSGGT